jgi:lipopolysaccharide/colanic/teichoic acid biosynthesis glycosyltransferase
MSVRPGMTGLWQISGRNDISYEERVELDHLYSKNLSLLEDLRILFMTLPAALRMTGA